MRIRNDRSRKDASSALIEQLEGRRLLSGNVAVTYDPATNTVNVLGDNKSNDILVSGNIVKGYTVTGQNGTTVNGGASAHVDPTGGQRANFDVALGNGDDAVEFNDFAALGVDVNTANGDDAVKLFNVTVFNGLDINTGNGEDAVSLDFVDIHQGLNIDTGNGEDSVTFGNSFTGVTVFDGDAHVSGGRGEDVLTGEANLHVLAGTKTIDSF